MSVYLKRNLWFSLERNAVQMVVTGNQRSCSPRKTWFMILHSLLCLGHNYFFVNQIIKP